MTSAGREPETGAAVPQQAPTAGAPHEAPATPRAAAPPAAGTEPADGREADRSVRRMYRPRRVIPAAIVATILAVLSILVAAEMISRLFDQPLNLLPVDDLARLGRETQWNDALAFTVAGFAVAIGVLLLLLALWPGRARAVAVASRRDQVVMAVTTSGLAHLAEQAAETVEGVARARASARPGQIRVHADSSLRDTGGLRDQVHRAVTDVVGQVEPVRQQQVRVTVRRREDAS